MTPLWWYLCFVACAGHPALEEAEGPADFVLLRLHLGRDDVLVPLLVLDPVSQSKTVSRRRVASVSLVIGCLRALNPNMRKHFKVLFFFLSSKSRFKTQRKVGSTTLESCWNITMSRQSSKTPGLQAITLNNMLGMLGSRYALECDSINTVTLVEMQLVSCQDLTATYTSYVQSSR